MDSRILLMKVGMATAASSPKMATTIINSTKVNPILDLFLIGFTTVPPLE